MSCVANLLRKASGDVRQPHIQRATLQTHMRQLLSSIRRGSIRTQNMPHKNLDLGGFGTEAPLCPDCRAFIRYIKESEGNSFYIFKFAETLTLKHLKVNL